MKVISFNLLFLVVPAIGVLAYFYINENPKGHFATTAEAVSAGAVGPGRVISKLLLPNDARDIVVQHDIDSNKVYLTYRFNETDAARPPNCEVASPVHSNDFSTPSWWKKSFESLGRKPESYLCIERTELGGFWSESKCFFAIGSTAAVWTCGSGNLIPKRTEAQQSVQPDRREDAAPG